MVRLLVALVVAGLHQGVALGQLRPCADPPPLVSSVRVKSSVRFAATADPPPVLRAARAVAAVRPFRRLISVTAKATTVPAVISMSAVKLATRAVVATGTRIAVTGGFTRCAAGGCGR